MNIEAFKTLGHLKQFTTGEFICTEQEAGNTAYLLLQGIVDVVRDAHLSSPESITRLKQGAVFGEMSLLENKPRNASVIAAFRAACPQARAFHMSGKMEIESGMCFRREGVPMGLPGLDEWHIQQTSEAYVRAARAALEE